ncbi:hypothetical protein Q0F98_37380 [Paenibacillus amylolyticus]|nr:hypothetical protein Q0F98_37380 [Paenibacillus amylolyticus]
MISLLEAGRFEDVEQKIEHIFEELLHSNEHHDIAESTFEVYFAIAGAFAYIIHKNGKQISSLIPAESYRYFQAPSYSTAQQLQDWSIRTLHYIRDDAEQELRDNHSTIVRSVKSFSRPSSGWRCITACNCRPCASASSVLVQGIQGGDR